MNLFNKIFKNTKNEFITFFNKRKKIKKYFSPNSNYRLETYIVIEKGVMSSDQIIEAHVYENKTNKKLFLFSAINIGFTHAWLNTSDGEYLISSESFFSKQLIFDLTNAQKNNCSSSLANGYCYSNYQLSPNTKILATIYSYGTYYISIKLFDFTSPMSLPHVELGEITLSNNNELLFTWVNDDTIKISKMNLDNETYSSNEASRVIKIMDYVK
jgi:hypothetical protein